MLHLLAGRAHDSIFNIGPLQHNQLAHYHLPKGDGGVMALVHEFTHYGDSSSMQL